MPNYTESLNLEKPLQTEGYNLEVWNANWDKIDSKTLQHQDNKIFTGVVTSNNITITTSKDFSYVDGITILFSPTSANTNACTINVNGNGAKSLKREGNIDLVENDLLVGKMYLCYYDQTLDCFIIPKIYFNEVNYTTIGPTTLSMIQVPSTCTKGQISAIIKGVTRTNLIPTFDSGEWTFHANVTVDSPTKITLNSDGSYDPTTIIKKAKENQDYVLSAIHNGSIRIVYFDIDNSILLDSGAVENKSITLKSPIGTDAIKCYLYSKAGIAGTYTFEDIMLEEGTEVNSFITQTNSTLSERLGSYENLVANANWKNESYANGNVGEVPTWAVSTTRVRTEQYKLVTPNKPFIVNAMNGNVQFYIMEVDENGKLTKVHGWYDKDTKITPLSTTYGVYLLMKKSDGSSILISEVPTIQPILCDTSKGSKVYVTLSQPLREVGQTKDEVNLSEKTLTKKISEPYIVQENDVSNFLTNTEVNRAKVDFRSDAKLFNVNGSSGATIEGMRQVAYEDRLLTQNIGGFYTTAANEYYFILPLTITTLAEAQAHLAGTSITYQYAEPITYQNGENGFSVLGKLYSYPGGGTVITERVANDVAFYDSINGMVVLDTEIPIESLDKIIKYDKNTGAEIEIDISTCTVAEDGMSFTSTELQAGDLVWFAWYHNKGTYPSKTMTVPINHIAQTNSNTDGIRDLEKKTDNTKLRVDALNLEVSSHVSGSGERIETGLVQTGAISPNTIVGFTFTFKQAFSSPPKVFLTIRGILGNDQLLGYFNYKCGASGVTATSFTVYISSYASHEHIDFDYMAIGK